MGEGDKMRGKSTNILFGILCMAVILIPNTFAATTQDTVTVDINIASVGAIVVNPTAITWASVNPGANGATNNLIIKNTGSMNLSNIYLDTSTITDESTNPLQTANPAAYSAAGLIFVKNTTDSTYYHAGRLEWNLSSVLTAETLDLDAGTTTFGHGWYRNSTGNEYLWKVENGTNAECNSTGTTFNIKTNPENATDLNRDLSSGLSTCGSITTGAGWGVFSCTDGPLNGYCVATANTCDKIHVYKYNYASTFPACGNRAYLRSTTLIPGTEDSISVYASVPNGIPAGATTQGTLTIVATY